MVSFREIYNRMMARVSSERDKRQGSIIHDSLSITAVELAQLNAALEIFRDQTYLLTATGINLDNRAADSAIVREPATYAIRIAHTLDTTGNPIDLPIGSRLSTVNVAGGINYVLIENLEPGYCHLQCEELGTIGNEYLGPLLPLFVINNLGEATMIGTYRPGQNEETDESLRRRVLDHLATKAFGGNVADYKLFVRAIDGVGDVKVFPVWDGGGTVKISIIDADFHPTTPEFLALVWNEVDPIPNAGLGMGVAPIGHRVTLETPVAIDIDITATVTLRTGYTIPQLQGPIELALETYIESLRKEWADAKTLSVFIARVNAAIINVQGVDNVTDITINGEEADLALPQTAELQLLPMLGEVVLTEAVLPDA